MDPETRIHVALGKILRYYNFLDTNLGLCIRFVKKPKDPALFHPQLAKMGMHEKLECFQKLVATNEKLSSVAKDPDFSQWIDSASNARAARNLYVHGTWEYLPIRAEKPLCFRLPVWMKRISRDYFEPALTLEELEIAADEMRAVFETFMHLRKKHGI